MLFSCSLLQCKPAAHMGLGLGVSQGLTSCAESAPDLHHCNVAALDSEATHAPAHASPPSPRGTLHAACVHTRGHGTCAGEPASALTGPWVVPSRLMQRALVCAFNPLFHYAIRPTGPSSGVKISSTHWSPGREHELLRELAPVSLYALCPRERLLGMRACRAFGMLYHLA